MRWKRGARSGDLVDRRGTSWGRGMGRGRGGPVLVGGGLGIPALLLLVFMVLTNSGGAAFDIDQPLDDLGAPPASADGDGIENAADDRTVDFMSFVLDDVQTFWEDTFRGSGRSYRRAKLVLFEGATSSSCGGATSDIGPHYCPADERIYLDLDFFRELRSRFGAPGDFAQAYVLAHEVAHHVQNVLGVSEQTRVEQQRRPNAANELSIRLELQADCFAGVWAFTTYERDLLESGDLEEGLGAAAAVGDDRIQEQAGARIDRERWTHGSSEQRTRWFRAGFADGDPNACDTFTPEQV